MKLPRPTTEQERLALKATVRHVMELAGGPTGFAHVTRVEAAVLSKYATPSYDCHHMPIDIALDLMRDTGSNGIVSAMAAALGYKLVALDAAPEGGALPTISDISRLGRECQDVIDAISEALIDGHISAADERRIGLPQCHDLLESEISAIDNRNHAPAWCWRNDKRHP